MSLKTGAKEKFRLYAEKRNNEHEQMRTQSKEIAFCSAPTVLKRKNRGSLIC